MKLNVFEPIATSKKDAAAQNMNDKTNKKRMECISNMDKLINRFP